jgi:hypothetical protein
MMVNHKQGSPWTGLRPSSGSEWRGSCAKIRRGGLAAQPKSFVVTTDSQNALEVYLNQAARMKLTGINRL